LLAAIPSLETINTEVPNGFYSGTIFRGVFHGSGVFKFKGGSSYTGQWRYGHRDGNGIM